MKRVALIAMPLVGMVAIVGLAFLLTRTQILNLRPRIKAARVAVADAIDAVADEIEEVLE